MKKHRDIAAAIVIATTGQFLFQKRDNIPGILYPGKVALFGGHREGNETFVECVARELHEELSYFIPAERFEPLLSYQGRDWEISGGTLQGEFFIVRDVPIDQIVVTEGTLLIVDADANFDELLANFAPSAARALTTYAEKHGGVRVKTR